MSSISIGASNTDNNNASRTSVVLTKPASLAVGDYLVAAVCATNGPGNQIVVSPPAGWTQIATEFPGQTNLYTFYKKADSTDVAATNFTFTFTNAVAMGGITRVIGADDTVPVVVSNAGTGSSTSALSSGITPGVEPYLMIVVGSVGSAAARTTSGYAVANNNPTWLEAYDIGAGLNQTALAMATGAYTVATATGNATATLSGTVNDYALQIIAFQPQIQRVAILTGASTLIASSSVKTIAVAILSAASSLIASSVVVTLKKWADAAKTAVAAFANTTKHSASPSNTSKHSSAWTDTPKS